MSLETIEKELVEIVDRTERSSIYYEPLRQALVNISGVIRWKSLKNSATERTE